MKTTFIIATQFKNESIRLEEWYLYYKQLGFTEFVLVDDNSTDNSKTIHKKIKDINVTFLPSTGTPMHYINGLDTELYRGSVALAHNIGNNFKNIHNYCLNTYGKNTILGFFDVDEFIFPYNENDNVLHIIKEEIKNAPVLSLHSLEVNSEKFNLNSWVTLQTTNSMSISNKLKCTRHEVYKSFQNLNFIDYIKFYDHAPHLVGIPIHSGGIDPDLKLRKIADNVAFLHYRKPIYDAQMNLQLCDTQYNQVTNIAKRALNEKE